MYRKSQRNHQPTGFTLIEILVVVAIIALLISILLPSLKAAREQARITVCKTRMQQIHRGHVYYSLDNKDVFPHWSWWLWDGKGSDDGKENFFTADYIYRATGGTRSTDSRMWVTYGDIFKYIKEKEVYFCPADNKQRGPRSIGGGGAKGNAAIHSYVRLLDPHQCFQAKIDGAQVGGKGTGAKLQKGDFINPDNLKPGTLWSADLPAIKGFFTVPSRVGMLYEEDQGLGDVPDSAADDPLNDGHSSVVVYGGDYISPRHMKKGHLAYFDGHVELMDAKRWNAYDKGDKYVLYRALGGGSATPPKTVP